MKIRRNKVFTIYMANVMRITYIMYKQNITNFCTSERQVCMYKGGAQNPVFTP
jgi:hypothetical protein